MSETFIATLVTLAVALALPGVMVLLSNVIGPSKYNPNKHEPVESGVTRTVGTARERFSIKFYLVAILFIVFDLEAAFLFPWAVTLGYTKLAGWVAMMIFLAELGLGLAYAWKKGALEWE